MDALSVLLEPYNQQRGWERVAASAFHTGRSRVFLRDWEPELGFGPGVLAPGAELFSLPYPRVSLSILPLQAALRSQHLGLPSGSWGTWSKVYVSQPQFPQRLTEAQRPPLAVPRAAAQVKGMMQLKVLTQHRPFPVTNCLMGAMEALP